MSIANTASDAAALAVLDDPLEQARCTRWVAGVVGPQLAESALQLSGLHCAACAASVERALSAVDGVVAASVSAAGGRASVRWDPARTRLSALVSAVQVAGYGAVPDLGVAAREARREEHRQALWRLFVAGFCAMQVMMLAAPAYFAGTAGSDSGQGSELAADMRQLLNWAGWVLTLPVMAFSAAPFFRGAWQALLQRRIGMDVPVSLGLAITFLASTAVTFDPAGPFGREVYFDSLTMFVSFLLGARYLELRSRHQAAQALEASLSALPETAWRVLPDGTTQPVSVARLRPGDLVRVPVGQAFPADGVTEQGHTRADETLLTGEADPVDKPPGTEVVAGSVNLGAPVQMRVRCVGGDTRLERIVAMMQAAMAQRPASARLADRWAAPFLWAVLLLAAAAAAAWSVIDPPRAVWVVVSVLIVTCPCALSLAVPATLVAAARGLARRGVMLQRLDALERLAAVQQVFFDKTGTLTDGRMSLQRARRTEFGESMVDSDAEATSIAASLARRSTHPVSQALAESLPGQADQSRWRRVEEFSGLGLSALDSQDREWRYGAPRWAAAGLADDEQVRAVLSCGGHAVALFNVEETLRPGAEAAVAALRAAGVRVALLTGDGEARARALALRLGIDDVHAGVTPDGKLQVVAAAQRAGHVVAMVGDGINDAPVLALADVSLAMGQGALIARSQADAVLVASRPADVVLARNTARRALAIVRQNLVWAAGYNAISIPLALAGWLPPWAAGLGMAGSSLAVLANALRAGRVG